MVNKERAIKLFEELVAVPCPSKEEKLEAELICAKLREMGLEPFIDNANEKTGGNVGNVWATVKGNVPDAPTVLFEAHMDSVSPATGTTVVHKDGVMYSDGTTTLGGDDKAGVVAAMEAVKAIMEDGVPHGDIQLLFTISEEIGCLGAVNLDKSLLKAQYGYCMDLGGEIGGITYAAPQMCDIYITVKGKAAHAGTSPEKGINAIMLAAKAISRIPQYGRIDEETTLSVDIFNAGTGVNIVCPEAKIAIDMRSRNVPKLEELKAQTIALFEEEVKAGGGQLEVEVVNKCPAICLDINHPCIQLAAKAAENLGYPVEYRKTGGGTDGNYLCGYGLPCGLLSTGMANVHTTEEYLKEEDLYKASKWAYEIIKVAAENK